MPTLLVEMSGDGETSELFRAALEAVADGIIVVASDGTLLYANEAFGLMWGIPKEVLGGTSHAFRLDAYMEQLLDADAFLGAIHVPAADDPPTSGTVRFRDGRVLEYRTRSLKSQAEAARVLSFRDVTDRVELEQALQSEGRRLATLLEQIPAAAYEDILDPTSPAGVRPVFMGEQIEAITGYSAKELVEDVELWEAIVHPDDRERVVSENRVFYEDPNELGQVFRIVSRDGRTVWIHDWGHVAVDPRTGERHIYGVILDVTHPHDVEQRAGELEAQWRAMLDEIPGVVYRYDANPVGRSQYGYAPWLSPAVTELSGHTQEEWMANPDIWVELLHPDDREWVLAESERTDRTGEPFDAEYRFLMRDGRVRWVHDRSVAVATDESGQARWWLGLMMDVTDRRTMQERLVQAQEEERARIAREIEDTSMQAMAAAGLRASVTLARAGVVDDPEAAAVQMAIEEAVSSLRRLLLELRPISLDRGLSDAAGQYLRFLADAAGNDLRFDDRLMVQPEEPLRTVAYRVIQAMGGATLGAGLGSAFLLENDENGFRILAVTATSPIENLDGLALAGERARAVGGRVDVSPDRTTVEAWLPAGTAHT